MTADARALEEWSVEIVKRYTSRSRPPGGPLIRLANYPKWGATVFYRKAREIGFAGAARLAFNAASTRLKAGR